MSVEVDPTYSRYIEGLLLQRTIAEMRTSVASSTIDRRKLDEQWEAQREAWERSGRLAACALLDFAKMELSDLLPEPRQSGREITDSSSLLEAAMSVPSALRTRSLLKQYHGLVTAELLAMVESKIIPGRDQAPIGKVALVSVVIGVLLGDIKARTTGTLMWSSVCCKAHRFDAAERHMKRAARLAAEVDDSESLLLVESNRAGLYRSLGRTREAIEIFETQLKHPGVDRVPRISLFHALVSCYQDSGQLAKALDAVAQLISLLDDDFPEKKFDALNLRGLLWEELGRFDKGAVSYDAAIAVAREMGDRGREFMAMNNRAGSLLKRGLGREGLRAFEKVLKTVEGWGYPPMIASAHNNLGSALLQMKRYAQARSEYQQALRSKMDTGDRIGQFICFLGMGDAAREMGNIEEAALDYGMGLVVALETMDASLVASITMRNADKEFRKLGNVDETIKSLKWARDLCNQQSLALAQVLITKRLIDCYVEAGRQPEGLAECMQILDARAFDPEMVGMLPIFVTCARLLASESGRWKDAFELLWERSKQLEMALEEAVIDARRAEIISRAIELYGGLIELLAAPEADQLMTESPSPVEFAFDLHESAKSRSFLTTMAEAPVSPPEGIPESLRQVEAELLLRLKTLQGDDGVKSEEYRDENLREARKRLRDCWEEIKPFAPAYVRFRTGKPYTFREMASRLPEIEGCDTAFASFFVDERRTTCFVFRAGSKVPKMTEIVLGRKDLTEMGSQLRRAFNGGPEEFPPYPPIRGDAPFRRRLDFLEPLEAAMSGFFAAVEGADLIVVAPHGPLHVIPLQVLHCPDGKYLAERAAVVYTPSLSKSMQSFLRGHAGVKTGAKIPAFAAGVSSADDLHPEYFEGEAEFFEPARWDLQTAFGVKEGTRDSVLSSLAGQTVIHLSCHGFFDSRNPLESGLVFSNGRERAPRDLHDVPFVERQGYLVTVRDLMRASLNAELVTLSACSSGLQAMRNAGDEMEGFSRALLAAGASATLVAMWNVDQESSNGLLTNFYARLGKQQSVSGKWRALHRAQLEYIYSAKEKLRHPYHWAPFVLIGDWR